MPAVWSERYETLRRYVLNNRQNLGADPLGLVLLLRQGVAAWMRSWREASTGPIPQAGPLTLLPVYLPDWQQQVTGLLAQITSSHLSVSLAL